MIRRITLTLVMGVAVLAAGSRTTVKAGPQSPRPTHRSGYIVASS